MARRGMTGQLNMFDIFNSLEAGSPGEVEMVSLVPEFDEEPVVVAEPETEAEPEPVAEPEPEVEEEPEIVEAPQVYERAETEKVSMSRTYQIDGESIEIAYINYNKVRIVRGNKAPEIKEFATTKEAVDYYVEQIQEYEVDE